MLTRNSRLVNTFIFASLSWNTGMIGYGMAKAAVHQLVHSMSQPSSGLPDNASVVAILP